MCIVHLAVDHPCGHQISPPWKNILYQIVKKLQMLSWGWVLLRGGYLNDASDSQVFDIVTDKDFNDVFSLQENLVLGVGLSIVVRASITDDPTFTIRAVKQFGLHCQGSRPDLDQKVLKKFSREVVSHEDGQASQDHAAVCIRQNVRLSGYRHAFL
ncbi:hypothetical protein Btru_020651 [Bulinus truncatus]|nr:hypothetical protein Btru_020651 [Bulinus truncatus]